ncbi:hypothetical protein PMAYCL1PPCAC_00260, partial [Pristionchus mayeri]
RSFVMNSLLFLVPLFFITIRADDPIENVALEWGPWVETPDSKCSDTCGYCGIRLVAQRTCPTLGRCSGIAQRYEECGSKMCPFPRKTCCSGYVKGLPDGLNFECVALAKIGTKTNLG